MLQYVGQLFSNDNIKLFSLITIMGMKESFFSIRPPNVFDLKTSAALYD